MADRLRIDGIGLKNAAQKQAEFISGNSRMGGPAEVEPQFRPVKYPAGHVGVADVQAKDHHSCLSGEGRLSISLTPPQVIAAQRRPMKSST